MFMRFCYFTIIGRNAYFIVDCLCTVHYVQDYHDFILIERPGYKTIIVNLLHVEKFSAILTFFSFCSSDVFFSFLVFFLKEENLTIG